MKIGETLIWGLDGASRIGALTGSVLCFGVMALVTADVVVRATLNTSIFGTIELSEFALVLIAFFAQAAAYTEGRHIMIDFFLQKTSPRVTLVLEFAMLTLSIGIVVLIALATIDTGLQTWEEGDESFALALPVGLFKTLAGIGLALLSLAMIRRWLVLLFSAFRT